MAKISVGDVMPDFVFDTPFVKGCRLSDAVKRAKKTAVVFLRYYGCTLCQLDILEFSENYGVIESAGGQLLIGLQSDPDKLASKLSAPLPFDILCDPEQRIYRALEIEPAASKEAMSDATILPMRERMKARGLSHGDYEGNELQLPATFILTPDMRVVYARYGKLITDVPTAEEIAALIS